MYKPNYEQDIFKNFADFKDLTITFIRHASLIFQFGDKYIYIDPVMEFCNYHQMPKADYILITHNHYDHFDQTAIDAIVKENTIIIANEEVANECSSGNLLELNNNESVVFEGIDFAAVPAYNVSAGKMEYHPRALNNGYVINFGGKKVYASGDTELIPDMKRLKNQIEIAFISVNQPYTMSVAQAIEAAKLINPKIFYPYHYGQTEFTTPINELKEGLANSGIEVRIRKLD